LRDQVSAAIESLPEIERSVTALFYISGYSMEEIGAFLTVPVSTVKGRLHSARNRLRVSLLDSIGSMLRSRRPSRDDRFAEGTVELLRAARNGDAARVTALLRSDPRLLVARDPMGNTALIIAVNSGHDELAAVLRDAGVVPGAHEAAAIGDEPRLRACLDDDPEVVHAYSPEGFPALSLAAHFGHLACMRLLLDRGADVNRVARHPLAVTALHAALFGRQVEAARVLIERGADVARARAGGGSQRGGWTALHYVAGLGFESLVEPLLHRGADVSSRDERGRTPLQVAVEGKHTGVAQRLRDRGAPLISPR
jgi:ankyrin repeat protein